MADRDGPDRRAVFMAKKNVSNSVTAIVLCLLVCAAGGIFAATAFSPSPSTQDPKIALPLPSGTQGDSRQAYSSAASSDIPDVYKTSTTETSFGSLFEGLAAMENVDIVSVDHLELAKTPEGCFVLTSLTFQNRNFFPILVQEGRLMVTFKPAEEAPVSLGTIEIDNVLLNGGTIKGAGTTRVEAKVRYDGVVEGLRPLTRQAGPNGDALLPLFIEGKIEVEVTVLSGITIEKALDVMLDFDPTVPREVLAKLRDSLSMASGGAINRNR